MPTSLPPAAFSFTPKHARTRARADQACWLVPHKYHHESRNTVKHWREPDILPWHQWYWLPAHARMCVCVSTTCQHDSGESVVIVKTHITSSPAEVNTHPNITREHKMRLSFKCVSSHKNIAARTSYLSLSSWDLGWPSSPAPPTTADHVHLAHCTGDSQDIPAPSTAA